MWRSAAFVPLNLWLPEGGADTQTLAFGVELIIYLFINGSVIIFDQSIEVKLQNLESELSIMFKYNEKYNIL